LDKHRKREPADPFDEEILEQAVARLSSDQVWKAGEITDAKLS